MEISLLAEKRMLEYVYERRAIQKVGLDSFWREYLAHNPIANVDVDDIKVHFLCMKKDENVWQLDAEAHAYIRFGAWAAELDQNAPELGMQCDGDSRRNLLWISLDRKQNLYSGLTEEMLSLFKNTFEGSSSTSAL